MIVVYTMRHSSRPRLVQVLPAGVGPEGLLAIPHRDLFVAASENDDRGAAIRSIITLYQLEHGPPTYPTILSANRADGLPIPWGALSALAADLSDPKRHAGEFWLVSEGAGSVDDPDRPVTSVNLLVNVAADGTVLEKIDLPAATNTRQRRFGLEGVAAVGSGDSELVYVAFQREWVGDPDNQVRIGRYEVATGEWTFFYYPLDMPTSPNGGGLACLRLLP